MHDEEGEHQESTRRVRPGHPFEREPLVDAERGPEGSEQVEQARTPDQRRDHGQQTEVGQALQRVVLLLHRLVERVRLAAEHAPAVVGRHRHHPLVRRQVLAPFTGGELPEDGEGPEREQQPGGQGVQAHRGLEAQQRVAAVYLEAADQHGDDQQRLRPVPEALVALVDVDAGGRGVTGGLGDGCVFHVSGLRWLNDDG
ncbi:hypothetical protein D9M68_826230 [compost metagenome]